MDHISVKFKVLIAEESKKSKKVRVFLNMQLEITEAVFEIFSIFSGGGLAGAEALPPWKDSKQFRSKFEDTKMQNYPLRDKINYLFY